MEMWRQYNPNPVSRRVGDCAVRAVAKATGMDWEQTYTQLAVQGYLMGDMPSANSVWGSLLRLYGFNRGVIPNTCPDCYTVSDFAAENPVGTFVLALNNHVVTVVDGDWYDTWDTGGEVPLYYYYRKDD